MKTELPAALCRRCRWYDVIATSGKSVPVAFRNNRLYSIAERESSGFGVRVNVDGRVGFSFTSGGENLEAAMRRAISSVRLFEAAAAPAMIAWKIARYVEEPWVMMTVPGTPSSGAPP